jgi:YegS C-terminal NAD kinase beta sandwich-like domain
MPITPGSAWGVRCDAPTDSLLLRTDREVGVFLRDHNAKEIQSQPISYESGDLIKVLGLDSALRGQQCLKVIVDAIAVEYEDTHGKKQHDVCFGSLHIGKRYLQGALSIVSNSGCWRGREVAPRAHPNDGKLDIVEISAAMRWSQRRLAWKKTAAGAHLPHPLIQYSQGDFFQWKGASKRLVIDGEFVAHVQKVSCRVQSDCLALFVS